MKKQLITAYFLTLIITAYAQVGVVPLKQYADFKTRTLLVIVEEPKQKMLEKLTPEQAEVYKQEIEEYNTLSKWAMDTYYKVGNPVEFKTRAEVEQIIAQRDKTYAFVEFTKFKDNYVTKVSFELVQKNRFAKEQSKLTGGLSLASIVSLINIRLAEESEDASPFYGQYLPNPFPDKADMAYAFKQIAATLAYRERGITYDKMKPENKLLGQQLKSLTLLIAEDDIDAKEDREKFVKAYPNPMEIVSKEKIQQAIIDNDPKYAVVLSVPTLDRETEQVKFQFIVMGCEQGQTMATSSPQDKSGVDVGPMVTLKALKKPTESKLPPLRKENLWDFDRVTK